MDQVRPPPPPPPLWFDVPTTAPEAGPPRGPRRIWPFVLAAVGVLVVAGGYAAIRLSASPIDDPLRLVPRGVFFYADADLDPSAEQAAALDALITRFPAAGSGDALRTKIIAALDDAAAEDGITFVRDIEPWLGDRAAIFFLPPPELESNDIHGALLVAADDLDAARNFIEKATRGDAKTATYADVGYIHETEDDTAYAIVEEFLVLGTERGLHAVIDAARGDAKRSLGGGPKFESAFDGLETDVLGRVYLDFEPFLEALLKSEGAPPGFESSPVAKLLRQSQGLSVYARSDGLVVDTRARLTGPLGGIARDVTDDPGLLPELPPGAWAALNAPRFGAGVQGLLPSFGGPIGLGFLEAMLKREVGLDLQRDVLSWIGDVALFAQGTDLSSLGGGLVIETLDQRSSARAVSRFGSFLSRTGAPVTSLTKRSFSIQDRSMPQAVNVISGADRVVAAYGRRATFDALGGDPRLGDDPEFQAARSSLGEGYNLSLYVDVQAAVALIERLLPIEAVPAYADVRPNLEPLMFVAAGSRVEGKATFQRILIGVR